MSKMSRAALDAEQARARASLACKSDAFVLALVDAASRHDQDWSLSERRRNRSRRVTVYAVSCAMDRGLL